MDVGGEWSDPDSPVTVMKGLRASSGGWGEDNDHLLVHKLCEVVVVRWSGAPVELGCFSEMHGHRTTTATWFDRDWLRLLWAIQCGRIDTDVDILKAVERIQGVDTCISMTRLRRLAHVFDWDSG